ncbi:MAG: hypothetical protein RL196_160 [Actinomycetota bacterium]
MVVRLIVVGFIKVPATIFLWLSKPVIGHPRLTWVLTLITLAMFGAQGYNESVSIEGVSGAFWWAFGLWAFAVTLGPIMIRTLNRQQKNLSERQKLDAAHITVWLQLAWILVTVVTWLLQVDSLVKNSQTAVHNILASLILLPSFALNLILLQRGLRDYGYDSDIILLNKTGTLTTGERKFKFVQLAVGSPLKTKNEVLALAGGLEPEELDDLSRAIRLALKRRRLAPVEVKDLMSMPGLGMSGRLGGSRVVIGGPAQLVDHNAHIDVLDLVRADQANTEGQTVLYVLLDGVLCGYLGFADEVRQEVKFFVQLLQYRRKRVVIISGDAHETTKFVAKELGCSEFFGEVLPHQHEALVARLSADGSKVLESNDAIETALQIERAVRDRRLQRLTVLLSLLVPAGGLVFGAIKVGTGSQPTLIVPALLVTLSLLAALAIIIFSRRVWHKTPKTVQAMEPALARENESSELDELFN